MPASLPPHIAYWLPPLATGAATALLALLIWLRRPSRPAAALSLYLLSAAIWSFGYSLQLCSTTLAGKVFWSKIQYVGPAGVSLAGLVFVLQYAGLNDWLRTGRLLMLAEVPVITQVLVWTNERHGLIWRRVWLDSSGAFPMLARTHGLWFWIFLVYGYALCLVSIVLLVREFLNRRGIYRSQALVLLVGCLVPLAGNLMYAFGFEPVPNLDLTVFGFSITGASMAWGLFRFQLPVILPVARQTVFEGMSDAAIALDSSGNIVEVNPEAARVFGQAAASLIGRPATSAFKPYPDLVAFCRHPQESRVELMFDAVGVSRRFDARRSLLKTRRQRVIGALIVLSDITEREAAAAALRLAHAALEQRIAERTVDLSHTIEELRQLENQLTFSASHDSLTGLANRKLFLDRVAQRLETNLPFAILYIDIDRFKVYNDGYGHHLGDLILIEMGRRLEDCVNAGDTVARMGGDEFTVLLAEAADVNHAFCLAQSCLQALAEPARVACNDIYLTASIGIAAAADQRRTAAELVRDADLAMYRAKRQGGNQTAFFGESMRASALSLLQLQQDLRVAVALNQIVVQYQPFVRIETGRVVGFEALVRWRHPERGLLQPSEFLPIAEQTGMLMAIDEFVLREACRQKASWANASHAGAEPPFVSVNVSGWQFSHPRRWWQALSSLNSQTAGLRLEMVESVLVANAHAAVEFFEQVRAHNLQIYLDDFGTGYSSLSWLSHFPIRSLKIDRSFVKEIAGGGRDISIVRAIIALAHSLEMEVVAEGIESGRQSQILQDLGCEFGQGFHFSPPVDGPTTLAMLN